LAQHPTADMHGSKISPPPFRNRHGAQNSPVVLQLFDQSAVTHNTDSFSLRFQQIKKAFINPYSKFRKMKKRMLIIAEHMMVGEFLTTFLQEQFQGFTIFCSTSMNEARELLHSVSFDLVLIDVVEFDISVLSIIKEISLTSPMTRCLLLCAEANAPWIDRAMRVGAYGFLTKTCASYEVVKAVDALIQGRSHLSPDVIQSLSDHIANGRKAFPHSALSPRELEIFVQIGQGNSLKKISMELKLSANTVGVHKHNISKKTGIKSTAKIAHYCIKHGLLSSAA
jgi:DNA-binding NarL/FixJ family response regulator